MFYFHTFFDEVSNRQILPSTYMVNDPRYTVADPRYTTAVLHILPSHTIEYRARDHWKKRTLAVFALDVDRLEYGFIKPRGNWHRYEIPEDSQRVGKHMDIW